MGLRRLTRLLTNRNSSGTWADVLSDSYNVLLALAMGIAILWSPLQRASQAPASTSPFQLEPLWLVVVGCAWAFSLMLAGMSRIGPVALSPAQARWWLPSLESRTQLLWPVLAMRGAISAAIGALIGLFLAIALATSLPITMVAGALLGTACTSFLVVAQPSRSEIRWTDWLMAAVPILGAVVAVGGVGVPSVGSGVALSATVLSAALAIAGSVQAWRSLPRIHDGDIARAARTAGHLGSTLLQLNTREFSRALERPRRRAERTSHSLSWVRGPLHAIATADTIRLARSPRHLAQLAVALAAVIIVVSLTSYSPVVAAFVCAAAGYSAALATADGARQAQLTPSLDSLMPLSARMIRVARLIVPSGVMALVAALMMAMVGVRVGELLGFALLGAVSAPAWGAGVLRAAYREDRQLSGVVVPTPMGAFPADAFQVFGTGIDLAVFALMPTWIAILLSDPMWQLILAQAVCSGLAAWAIIHAASKR